VESAGEAMSHSATLNTSHTDIQVVGGGRHVTPNAHRCARMTISQEGESTRRIISGKRFQLVF
jgi:hypothetical protein